MKHERPIIISIVEDQVEIGSSLKTYINTQTEFCCDVHYPNALDALSGIPSCKPDIVICDIGLPDMNGVECMKIILLKTSTIKFIMFTVFDTDTLLFDALKVGASGYILKNDSFTDIVEAIREVNIGGGPMSPEIAKKVIASFQKANTNNKLECLTDHQKRILKYISDGLLNKEIADLLHVHEGTIKVQITTIYKKLQVNNRVEASNIFRNSS